MQTNAAIRVLVTGAQGFTGRYMVQEMQQAGYQVYGLGSSPGSDIHYLQADLTNTHAVKEILSDLKPDYVIHLAAVAFVGYEDVDAFYQVNVLGTHNLLANLALMPTPVKGVLLASSANIYGTISAGIQNEETPSNPVNDYAVSKLAMEDMAKIWMKQLPIIITRPFNYTGVGQAERFLLPKIVAHFRRNETTIELGNIDVWRDFSDVRDVVLAYRRLLERNVYSDVVNVCSGSIHSIREVIDYCKQLTGHQINICTNSALVRDNEVKTLRGDNSKLRRLIDDVPNRSLEDTLIWMLGL